MLEARHLVKRFHGITAVNDVSFIVRPGEIVGYLGPNGSGKTTTGRILTRLIEPSSGTVWFDGREVGSDLIGFRRRLGYVPEEPQMYTFLSAREYLEFIGNLRELPSPVLRRKVSALLELFGLADVAELSLSSYSKGMKQKVLIAAALLHDPDVVIFDEPESGLDVTSALVLRRLVQALASRGKAILYSSHVLEIVEKLCTRVVILHQGRVVAESVVEELRAQAGSLSLAGVFSKLTLKDPATVAHDILDIVSQRA
jgi:ABC-2 type transport system ATP-binding protein